MCALLLSAKCRVCLAGDREMYRLANTVLEETYERLTNETLIKEEWPCCVCGLCLSALRRCRRFIDAAREANVTLNQWIQNKQLNKDTFKVVERPLFTITRSSTRLFEIRQSIQEVKREIQSAENEVSEVIHQQGTSEDDANIMLVKIKHEAISDDENDDTHLSDTIDNNSQVNSRMIEIQIKAETLDNIKFDISSHHKGSFKQTLLTQTSDKSFCCDRCDCKYNRKSSLNRHLMTHTGEKPFSCNYCEFKCIHKGSLKVHLLTHTGIKPLSCNKCNYKCIQRSNLKRHLLTHTGEKPFSCNKCGFKCRNQGNLKEHLLTHTGEKPFSCNICDFKCSKKGSLKRHTLLHTGEKPFSCDKCDYKCKHRDSLNKHLLTHTGEKPFSCDKCEFRCNRKGSLKRHLVIHASE